VKRAGVGLSAEIAAGLFVDNGAPGDFFGANVSSRHSVRQAAAGANITCSDLRASVLRVFACRIPWKFCCGDSLRDTDCGISLWLEFIFGFEGFIEFISLLS
jgi:hypothetical protein